MFITRTAQSFLPLCKRKKNRLIKKAVKDLLLSGTGNKMESQLIVNLCILLDVWFSFLNINIYVYIKNLKKTNKTKTALISHVARCMMLAPCWVVLRLRSSVILRSINSTEAFLRSVHLYIAQLLQISPLHIHDANQWFDHIREGPYLTEIWSLWGPLEYSELIVVFRKQFWDDLRFLMPCGVLLEVAVRSYVVMYSSAWCVMTQWEFSAQHVWVEY